MGSSKGSDSHPVSGSEELFRSLIESLPQNIFAMDREGRYTFANPQYCRTEGRTAEEILGKSTFDLHPRELAEKYEEDNRQIMESRIGLDVVEVHQPVGGEKTWVQVIKTPVYDRDQRVIGVLGAFWDVTALVVAEDIQRDLNRKLQEEMVEKTRLFERFRTELEAEVQKRTEELHLALARQVELNRALTQAQDDLELERRDSVQREKLAALGGLVAGVAHEINTPVGNSVTAITYLDDQLVQLRALVEGGQLTRGALETFLSEAAEATNLIRKNLFRAVDLVNTFKKVSVDQGSEARRSFLLAEYLRDILRSQQFSVRTRNLRVDIRCPEDLSIDGYPGALFQIITNLVNNALLHAFPEDQSGTLVLEAQLDGEVVDFTFTDNGVGIDEAHLPQIFDPFFTTKRGQGGSGLGLHIVYNLVTQQLGGTVHCTSAPGAGCRFRIRFPRVAAS